MCKNDLSDDAIARRVLGGDKDAYGYWVDKYSDLVFAITLKYTHDRREALDLTQDVFVKAYQALNEVKDHSIFAHWLSKIAANAGLNWLRNRRNARVASFSEMDDVNPDEIPDGSGKKALLFDADNETVIKALAQLPEELRVVVLKKYMDDCSYEKIAGDLSLSVATVRTRIARAKQILKSMIVKDSSRQSAAM